MRRTGFLRRALPTRDGWWFLAATALVGAIAIDAGLNLFLLAFAAMVCLVGASLGLAETTLSGLDVRRVLPSTVFVGTPYLMGIALENRKRRMPSFSIEVEDLVDGQPIEKRCYFLKLPAGRRQETAYRHTATKRGRYRLTGFRLVTRFPFGLLQRSRIRVEEQEICVYPALAPPPAAFLRALPAGPGAGRERRRGRQGEFAGLRAFRPGDDPRDIHWRTSARRGTALVREHEDEEARQTLIALDNDPEAAHDTEAFERAVSEAAGLCVELARRGFAVGLRTRGSFVRPAIGPTQTQRLLRTLAMLGPEAGPRPNSSSGMIVRVRPGDAPQLVLPSARGARTMRRAQTEPAKKDGSAP